METSIGPEVPAEEIVDNKTVKVDNEELPPEIPGAQIVCQGCTTVGHNANSCPLTSCQQFKLKRWMEKGTDRLSTSSDDSARDLLAPPAGSVPSPVLQTPISGNLDDKTGPSTPTPTAEQTGEKTAPIPPQKAPPPPTKQQQTSNDVGMSSADGLLSSIGARTKGRTRKTTQPGAGATPIEGTPETAPSKPAEGAKPILP